MASCSAHPTYVEHRLRESREKGPLVEIEVFVTSLRPMLPRLPIRRNRGAWWFSDGVGLGVPDD